MDGFWRWEKWSTCKEVVASHFKWEGGKANRVKIPCVNGEHTDKEGLGICGSTFNLIWDLGVRESSLLAGWGCPPGHWGVSAAHMRGGVQQSNWKFLTQPTQQARFAKGNTETCVWQKLLLSIGLLCLWVNTKQFFTKILIGIWGISCGLQKQDSSLLDSCYWDLSKRLFGE